MAGDDKLSVVSSPILQIKLIMICFVGSPAALVLLATSLFLQAAAPAARVVSEGRDCGR